MKTENYERCKIYQEEYKRTKLNSAAQLPFKTISYYFVRKEQVKLQSILLGKELHNNLEARKR